jgi:hypothetical protein
MYVCVCVRALGLSVREGVLVGAEDTFADGGKNVGPDLHVTENLVYIVLSGQGSVII